MKQVKSLDKGLVYRIILNSLSSLILIKLSSQLTTRFYLSKRIFLTTPGFSRTQAFFNISLCNPVCILKYLAPLGFSGGTPRKSGYRSSHKTVRVRWSALLDLIDLKSSRPRPVNKLRQ
jgi:hypothetical protein